MGTILQKKPQGSPMKHLKTLLLIVLTLGFTACTNENDITNSGNSFANQAIATPNQPELTIDPTAPSLYNSLKLTAKDTTLNRGGSTALTLLATLPDGTSKELNTDIEYIITPNESAEANNNTLVTKKDGTLTLQAKAGNTLSNTLTLDVTWTVNGYTLPPEPNKEENEKTLLGIDSNTNGVRDDVERAIYERFPKEIRRQQLMQQARAHQSFLADEDAITNAQKWEKIITKDIACAKYLFRKFNIDFDLEADAYMKNVLYNTKERVFNYVRFNHALGGGVYSTPESLVNEHSCEFDVAKALKAD